MAVSIYSYAPLDPTLNASVESLKLFDINTAADGPVRGSARRGGGAFAESLMWHFAKGETGDATLHWGDATSTTTTGDQGPELRALTLVRQVREHIVGRRLADAIDMVYDTLDELLLAGLFDDAAAAIRALARSRVPLSILLSALTISLPWRKSLGDARVELIETVRLRALEEGGEGKAAAVLHGLV